MVSKTEWVVVQTGKLNKTRPMTKTKAEAFKVRMKSRYPWLTFEVLKQ